MRATWSLINKSGGVSDTDLIAALDGKSATFTGHVVGTARMQADTAALTATASGILTVSVGTATKVRVETSANGSGNVVGAQTVASGSAVTGYAITRDASNNFVANVRATWLLINKSGGVSDTDLIVALDGKSATFTGHVVGTAKMQADTATLTATASGILTVSVGTATKVRVETSANGSGSVVGSQTVASGSTVTGYAITRDASDNFVASVRATWSLINKSGGVSDTDLIAAPDGKSATFTGHVVGTARMQADTGSLTPTPSGILTVSASTATKVIVETSANGSGNVVGAQTVASGSTVTGYAITRDASDNFVASVRATWSLINKSGGVSDTDLIAAPDGKSATFTGHVVGTARMQADTGSLTPTPSGILTVSASTATKVIVETSANGSGNVVGAQTVASGSTVTGYAIMRDSNNNFVANVRATWSLINKSGGVSDTDLVAAPDGKSATFTGHVVGTARMQADTGSLTPTPSGILTVSASTATKVIVETSANGSGNVVGAQTVASGSTVTGYAIMRDSNNNFVANVRATWSLINKSGGVSDTDLVSAPDGKSATFTGHVVGTARMQADTGSLTPTPSGILTVSASTATKVIVETSANGSGSVVGAQTVASGSTVTGYAIMRDSSNNFVANVRATWLLINKSGGVSDTDLIAAPDGKSATFTGHVVGTAQMQADSAALTATPSGILTVSVGTATKVRVETSANGSGSVVGAQTVASGSTVTGYTITRDASDNFVANVRATWSLINKSGGVSDTDLIAAPGGKSATFTGHVVGTAQMQADSAALTATPSGILTVSVGTATKVRVETSANGSGSVVGAQTVASGSAVTGYAITRDASDNFVANVRATWSLINKSGGVSDTDLIAAPDGKSATFTGHVIGTARMQADSAALTATASGILTVSVGTATKVRVETSANGSGSVVGSQTVASGSTVTGYTITRDASDNFVASVRATWSLINKSGGVSDTDLIAAPDGKSATFTGHVVGTAQMQADSAALTATPSGILTVSVGTATKVRVETSANGSGSVVGAQTVASGSTVTGYTITRDASDNFVANVRATWSLINKSGGVSDTDLIAAPGGKSATFTGHVIGTARMQADSAALTATPSGILTVSVGTATKVRVETSANGSGNVVGAQMVASGSTVTGYAIMRDSNNNFVANVRATWSLINKSGGVSDTDLIAAPDGKSATFTGHVVGTAKIQADTATLTATASGILTVSVGTATKVRVETSANGSGSVVGAQTVASGSAVTGYAITRDASDNFVASVRATWSLINKSGGVSDTDLIAAPDGKSATFTGHVVGTAQMQADSAALTTATPSGILTVSVGTATKVRVETSANGSGNVVGAQTVASGSAVTGYAITRDASNNFVASVRATWLLINKTGGISDTDLIAAPDGKSATFTGHVVGTARMQADSAALTATASGILTVGVGTATKVRVETSANGSGNVVGAQTVASGSAVTGYAITRDASNNFVANVRATWLLINKSGGVSDTDLIVALDGKSATFTGHVVGTAKMQADTATLTATASGILTVSVGTATKVRVETSANGSGSVVGSQTVASGSTVTGYAITRDASDNFVASVRATWSLINKSGGVSDTDLIAAPDGKSATFTGHVVGTAKMQADTAALTATASGILTVSVGTATKVRVETSANGSGNVVGAQTVASGSAVTGYVITRDASNNFVANVRATWLLINKTGGISDTDLIAAPDGKSATFTGHVVGTARMQADSAALTATASGILTVGVGTATKVRVETSANGSGNVVGAQTVASGSAVTGYAITRDASNNFVANVRATWLLINKSGGVSDTDLIVALDGKSATFTGHVVGTAKMQADTATLTATASGILTVSVGTATKVRVETSANGSGSVVGSQTVASGSTVTGYAITRDASDNFVASVRATWSLINKSGGVSDTDLIAAPDGKSATFTGHVVGTARMQADSAALTATASGILTVGVGTATKVRVETSANGSGNVVGAQTVASGSAVTGYVITRDASNNFVANVRATWLLINKTGGISDTDLIAAPDGKSATFTGHVVGTARMQADSAALTATASGILTVGVGTATKVRVETSANGSGNVVGAQTVASGSTVTGYAITRDASDNFVANVRATWLLINKTGGVSDTDLIAAPDGKSATFTGHVIGTAKMRADTVSLTPTPSGTLSVSAGAASKLAIVQQPTDAIVGDTIVPAITIQLKDQNNNNVTSSGQTIRIAISYGNGVLSGVDSALTNVSGLANFAGLRIDSSGRKALTATSAGLTSAISDTFSILPIRLSVKAFLQGPYNAGTGQMNTTLKSGGHLAAHFGSMPIPGAAVDSINIEIRDSVSAAQATVRRFAAAWLMSDGSIKLFSDTTKAYVELEAPRGSYYVVVRHRNHLAIMSVAKAVFATDSTGYNFTTAQAQAYGTNPMAALTGGVFGLPAADVNLNGGVGADDITAVYNTVGLAIYTIFDVNMNGGVGADDITATYNNVGFATQVPE